MNLLILTTKFLLYLAVVSPHVDSALLPTENERIIGGEKVPKNTYPWFTRIVENENDWWGCGGMLISPEYVLTAAHCFFNYYDNIPDSLAVQIGALKFPFGPNKNGKQKVERFSVTKVILHPEYNSENLNNDYALLRLDGLSTIDPVTLDSDNLSDGYTDGQGNLWTVGLGNDDLGDIYSFPKRLRHVEVKYVPTETCKEKYSYYGDTTFYNILCAAGEGKDSCQGDSGGPLYDKHNNKVIGVVSFGIGCADPRYPGVYAKVSAAYDWIKSEVCNKSNDPPNCLCSEYTRVDSPLPFQLTLKNGKKRFVKCAWIKKNQERKNYYCARNKVKAMCPSACDRCDICKDSKFKFKVKTGNDKKMMIKECPWFLNNRKDRCGKFEGVSDTCRESCDTC